MRKHWSEVWRKAVEAEFDASIGEIVDGFFSDGESLASIAAILDVRDRDLAEFCAKRKLPEDPKGKRAQGKTRAPSPTRSAAVRAWRRRRDKVHYTLLSEAFGVPKATIIRVHKKTGNILRALQ